METVGCKGVVFAALIDDAEVSVGCCFIIRNYLVKFPYLQRSELALVVKA